MTEISGNLLSKSQTRRLLAKHKQIMEHSNTITAKDIERINAKYIKETKKMREGNGIQIKRDKM